MTTQAPSPAPQVPRTPAQKHAAARQSQSMGRFGGGLILLVALGLPALIVGLILYGFVAAKRREYARAGQPNITRRRYAILLLGVLVGMIVVGLGYQTVVAQAQAIGQMAKLY